MDLHQSINEKRNTFSADTFRPSESQKAVLLAMDQITAGGRVMKKADVTTNENEQKAFDAMIDLELIEVDEAKKATLTSTGNTVVENIKAENPELAGEEDMDTEAEPESDKKEEPPMESFKLLKNINSTLLEDKKLNKIINESQALKLNGKEVDIGSIHVGGVGHDRTDLADAYIEDAKFKGGRELTDKEKEQLEKENENLVMDVANDQAVDSEEAARDGAQHGGFGR